jgi:RNA polymerase sigma-70 factor (ECF subfamily)
MPGTQPDTEELLRRARAGDGHARGVLLERHRSRLRRLIALRLDPRLAARLDASDVIQEALAEADRRLDRYLQERPLPFYPWLRQLVQDRVADLYRRHVRAARRSVTREQEGPWGLPDASSQALAECILARDLSPSEDLRREEARGRVQTALGRLSEGEREVLALRYLEQLPAAEVAAVLRISEEAAKKRALRALQRLRGLLRDQQGEQAS